MNLQRILSLSPDHLPQAEFKRLQRAARKAESAYVWDRGDLGVMIDVQFCQEGFLDNFEQDLCPTLQKLLRDATAEHATWLNLDPDADTIDSYKTFNWLHTAEALL